MGQWRPVSNLRGHLSRRPPVVVFFLCLLTLAMTFVFFGLYSQYHDLRNPDTIDWNQVVGSVTGFRFCTNLTDAASSLQDSDSPRMMEHGKSAINVSTGTAHVSFLVTLVVFGNVSDDVIDATFLGSQIGLKGALAKTLVNISVLPHGDGQTGQRRHACLRLTSQANLLLQPLPQPECRAGSLERSASVLKTVAVPSHRRDSSSCFSLEFRPGPHLTVLLSPEEKALCRFHLLLASAALLVLCALMSLCGSFASAK